MRHAFLATPILSVLAAALPAALMPATALAQSAPVEVRVDRLEKEMKAVQRKVFPGGTPIEADITRQPTAPVPIGTPASTPISDLISRVDALESQLQTLTGQTEQNAYKIKQLEDAFARYKTEAAAASAPPPTVATQPAATATPPKPVAPAVSDARKAAVAVIEKPDTGDAPADAYTYGYRLWDAKFYPEAQAQLKATVDKYATNGVASRASNLLGRAYLDDGKPALASVAFYENYQKRPRGDRAADSLTWLGEALIQLKKPADACKVYGELEQVYGATLAANLRSMMDKGRTRAGAAPDAATERFTRAVARLTDGSEARSFDTQRFGVAVSGGPDSMALLLLAHTAFPGRVAAATVDHGLRPQSAEEAAMVATCCAAYAIPHATLRPAQPITGNIQSAARTARYALLDGWRTAQGLDWLMTAHHADDQLETVLMRLNRGSGVAGLAGVRSRTGPILRPLLDWRKAELAALAAAAGMPVVHDPSNRDPRFDRAALRARLADTDWLDPLAAARSAAALAEAEAALDWLTRDLAARHVAQDGGIWSLAEADVPREVQRRLLLHMLAQADPAMPAPRGDALDHAIDRLRAGGKASIGHWLLQGGNQWILRAAPPRRGTEPADKPD